MPLAGIAAENQADTIHARIVKRSTIAMMNAIAAKNVRRNAGARYDN